MQFSLIIFVRFLIYGIFSRKVSECLKRQRSRCRRPERALPAARKLLSKSGFISLFCLSLRVLYDSVGGEWPVHCSVSAKGFECHDYDGMLHMKLDRSYNKGIIIQTRVWHSKACVLRCFVGTLTIIPWGLTVLSAVHFFKWPQVSDEMTAQLF